MPHLDLSDDEAAALINELHDTIDNDRYPFLGAHPRLEGIIAKLRPEPIPEPLPPRPKHYEPPRFIRGRRCRD
jgi:hypothetical protein